MSYDISLWLPLYFQFSFTCISTLISATIQYEKACIFLPPQNVYKTEVAYMCMFIEYL